MYKLKELSLNDKALKLFKRAVDLQPTSIWITLYEYQSSGPCRISMVASWSNCCFYFVFLRHGKHTNHVESRGGERKGIASRFLHHSPTPSRPRCIPPSWVCSGEECNYLESPPQPAYRRGVATDWGQLAN